MRNKIGHRIATLRTQQGLTQVRFALMTGINRSHLSQIEHGMRDFSVGMLEKVVDGLGVTMEEFFKGM